MPSASEFLSHFKPGSNKIGPSASAFLSQYKRAEPSRFQTILAQKTQEAMAPSIGEKFLDFFLPGAPGAVGMTPTQSLRLGMAPAFAGIKYLREKAESLSPSLAEKGVNPAIAGAMAAVPALAMNIPPASETELGLIAVAPSASKAILSPIQKFAKYGASEATINEISDTIAGLSGISKEAVKARISSAVDPLTKKLRSPEALNSMIAGLEDFFSKTRNKLGAKLAAVVSRLDKNEFNRVPIVELEPLRRLATNELTTTQGADPALQQILKALKPENTALAQQAKRIPPQMNALLDRGYIDPEAVPVMEKILQSRGIPSIEYADFIRREAGNPSKLTLREAVDAKRALDNLIDYRAKNPASLAMPETGQNVDRVIRLVRSSLNDQIIEGVKSNKTPMAQEFINVNKKFHNLAEVSDEFRNAFLGKQNPQQALLGILKKESVPKTPLEETASRLPQTKEFLNQANQAFVSQETGKFLPKFARTGYSLNPLQYVASPYLSTSLGRAYINAARQYGPALRQIPGFLQSPAAAIIGAQEARRGIFGAN